MLFAHGNRAHHAVCVDIDGKNNAAFNARLPRAPRIALMRFDFAHDEGKRRGFVAQSGVAARVRDASGAA